MRDVLIGADSSPGVAAAAAIRGGDLAWLRSLIAEHPELATAKIGDEHQARSLLHVATDWPGHFPGVARTIRLLVAAGAEVDARFVGAHTETPLHWAASSNDVAALDALLDAGADIEADGSVLGGGSPLTDATGFGQWDAARRLVERGAVLRFEDAAALGMLEAVEQMQRSTSPDAAQITNAFWYACHGGHRRTAEHLLTAGADLNWVGWGDQTPLDMAAAGGHAELVEWLRRRGARRAVTSA